MGRGPSQFNFVTVTLGLLMFAGAYLSYKYLPIFWTKTELQNVVKEECFHAGHAPDEEIKTSLMGEAKVELHVELNENDIDVAREGDHVRIHVVWRPVVNFLGLRSVQHAFEITESATFY